MPGCCAHNCSERSEKGVRLFLLPQGPKNEERRKQWINNLKRGNLPTRAYVCEKHFTSDQFENKRLDNKKPLRWDAVPSIFSSTRKPKKRKNSTIPISKNIEVEDCTVLPRVITSISSNSDNDLQPVDPLSNDLVKEESHLPLEEKLSAAYKRIKQLETEAEMFKQQVGKVFNEDQIQYLQRGALTGRQWSCDTIKKCLKICLLCGITCYEELRTQQHFPLPCIRTLQKHIGDSHSHNNTILEDLFPPFQTRVDCIKPEERQVVVLIDEMALKPYLQCNNTSGDVGSSKSEDT